MKKYMAGISEIEKVTIKILLRQIKQNLIGKIEEILIDAKICIRKTCGCWLSSDFLYYNNINLLIKGII